jgi:hypothetical protein
MNYFEHDSRRVEKADLQKDKIKQALVELDALLLCSLRGTNLTVKEIDAARKDGLTEYSVDKIKRAFAGSLPDALVAAGIYRPKQPGSHRKETYY